MRCTHRFTHDRQIPEIANSKFHMGIVIDRHMPAHARSLRPMATPESHEIRRDKLRAVERCFVDAENSLQVIFRAENFCERDTRRRIDEKFMDRQARCFARSHVSQNHPADFGAGICRLSYPSRFSPPSTQSPRTMTLPQASKSQP